jgi:glyoxylase I family protein
MGIGAFDHFNLSAHRADLERLRDFYVTVVGMIEGPRPASIQRHGYWLYADNVPVLHLIEAREGDLRLANVSGTFNHVAFRCTGFGETLAGLRAAGVEPRCAEDPAQALRQLFFKDPLGNGVELAFDLSDT